MITIAGIVLNLMLAITIGKHTRQMRMGTYVFITLLALLLVGMIMYDMYTMPYPVP